MRRAIFTFVITIVIFILQSTLFQAISLGGISPNVILILTASYGFMRGKKTGLLVGFLSGLLMDIFFGMTIGFYALIYMYIGYLNGLLHDYFFKEDVKLPLFIIAISDLGYNLVIYVLLFLLRGRFHILSYLIHIILPEVVYTILLTILLYPLLHVINKRFDTIEQRSAKKFV